MSSDEGGYQGDWRCGRRVLRTLGLGWQTSSPALEAVRPHNLLDHSCSQALLEPAELTPVPPSFVHRTALVRQTDVFSILLYSSLEEPLAALAGPHPVVLAGCIVTTHCTEKGGRLVLKQELLSTSQDQTQGQPSANRISED